MQGVVLAEEFAKAKAPMRADFFGDTLVGPTILMNGTEEQKKYFLPKILDGSMRWCQGFSEPDSGSDLASLSTTAVQDGDEWVINGQKVWTTQAQFADYCFVLARTDPDVKKQAGISYLLVPMKQPGVEVRGIVQPDGTDEFNEVFFSDARCPIDNVVGGLNNGWKVANDTLGFERGMSATTGYRRFAEEYRLMVEKATENGAIEDPTIRQRLDGVLLEDPDHADQRPALAHRDGQSGSGTWASRCSARPTRCSGPRPTRTAMELALDIWGAESLLSTAVPRAARGRLRCGATVGETYPVSLMMSAFFFSRSETIWGGTSQIQRNIVGEKVLGLPREPKAPHPSA